MNVLKGVFRWGSVARACRLTVAAILVASGSAAYGENRSFNGMGNNTTHLDWGAAGSMFLRLSPDGYADGASGMGGTSRPNPRAISNAIVMQSGSIFNGRDLSDWVWQWGQFLDHDMDLIPVADPVEVCNIDVPVDDPVFNFAQIPANRSTYNTATGTGAGNPRQQINAITSYLDGSMVYGSDSGTANSLRGGLPGRMLTTSHAGGDLLPQDVGGNFLAGDVRVNEQLGLTAVHTLFVREHNYWAQQIESDHPEWNSDEIYHRARKIVGAEIQAITFNEWLPALTGGPMPAYSDYNSGVDATVSNEFAGALFRVGHTMLSPQLLRLGNDGEPIAEGHVSLQEAFFQPNRIVDEGGVDPLLKGLASQAMQEIDQHIVEDVRSFLFTIPTGGLDLAALNIQRGRDHGLSDYNSMRVAYGLPAVATFSDITSNATLAGLLASVYGSVNDIDPWLGALCEDHLPGSSLGPLHTAAILDQFFRARDGDRFWYEHDPELADLVSMIADTTLADIIRRNTGITNLQADVFFVPEPGAVLLLVIGGLVAGCHRRRA